VALYPYYALPGLFGSNVYPSAVNGSLWSPAILKESERLHFLDSQGQLGMIPFGDEAD
jgi:hypothetical protein